jgi:hypothetical protein
VLGQHVQCVYKGWEKGQWLPTVACAILNERRLKKICRPNNSKCYSASTYLSFEKLKPGSKLSVSENKKIALRWRIASGVWPSLNAKQKNELHTLCVDH